jgi:undecaprenyl-diphosphatase
MTVLQSIIMGAIQGITEFLPISSSAHLVVIPWIFRINEANIDSLLYDVMLHLGTALALVTVYAVKIMGICRDDYAAVRRGAFSDSTILKIVVGTLPAAITGVLFKDIIENQLRTPYVVVFTLVTVSLLMLLAERTRTGNRKIGYGFAFLVGVAQAMALVPGVSRSGITITIAMLVGLRRTEAVDFTFLLSIPIVFGVGLFEARHLSFVHMDSSILYVVGVLSSYAFGVASLKFLIDYLKKHTLDIFAYYRIGLAALILFFLVFR